MHEFYLQQKTVHCGISTFTRVLLPAEVQICVYRTSIKNQCAVLMTDLRSGFFGDLRRCEVKVRAHRSVWGRSSCGICLCLSAWRRSSSAGARPWRSFSSSSVLPERRRRVQQEQRGVSAPSSCSDHSFLFTLSHDCDSLLALRAAEQEMNSTHSFPKFPSPPPPPPPPVPPPTLPPATERRRQWTHGKRSPVAPKKPHWS